MAHTSPAVCRAPPTCYTGCIATPNSLYLTVQKGLNLLKGRTHLRHQCRKVAAQLGVKADPVSICPGVSH